MTLNNIIKLVTTELITQIRDKISGSATFKVNLSEGGITNCNVNVDKTIKKMS